MVGFIIILSILIIIIIKFLRRLALNDLNYTINLENDKINSEYNEDFYPTEIVVCCMGMKRYIEVDISNKKWRINKTSQNCVPIYNYDDLRDFELLKKSNGMYTSAYAQTHAYTTPDIIFNDCTRTNAYANVQARTIEDNEIIIRISFKDLSVPDDYIIFDKNETDDIFVDSEMCMSLLRRIKAYNKENKPMIETAEKSENDFSVANELIKLKSLLDEGIITEEEFKKQKAKLL